MLESLHDKLAFKKRNFKGWQRNADFWLHSPLRHLEDTRDFLTHKLSSLFKDISSEKPTVVDMGAGSGWALDLLRELEIKCRYAGLDFNPKFIDFLEERFSNESDYSFYQIDLEDELPIELLNAADVVFNFFNFFEIANLEKAFKNASLMLKPGGKLVVMTIDSYYLMFALVESLPELKELLSEYELRKIAGDVPYFFQKIDLGDGESEEYEYASVLYSLGDYYREARSNDLRLVDYSEVIKTSKFIPKVYQYIVLEK